MMIPVLQKSSCLAIATLILTITTSYAQPTLNKSYFVKQGELVDLSMATSTVCLLRPVYENREQLQKVYPISYSVSKPFPLAFLRDSLTLGTNLVATRTLPYGDTVTSYNVLAEYAHVCQVVVTKSEGYLGYLEELLNVPFAIPPRRLADGNHQTDYRIATDCAELAIYGLRRQGFSIPYCGPKHLHKYLETADSLAAGTIIHFRHQVSVLYEDRGKLGVLDADDLLIHAYKDKAEIARLGDTDLLNRRYKLYKAKPLQKR